MKPRNPTLLVSTTPRTVVVIFYDEHDTITVYVKGLLLSLYTTVSRFRNTTPCYELILGRFVQFVREEDDSYRARYMGSSSGT